MPTFIDVHIILDMNTGMLIFQNFSGPYNIILFNNLLLYIWPIIYLFVLGRDGFFTVYICFLGTLFFLQII